jgi:hypothetical protein
MLYIINFFWTIIFCSQQDVKVQKLIDSLIFSFAVNWKVVVVDHTVDQGVDCVNSPLGKLSDLPHIDKTFLGSVLHRCHRM